MRHAFKLFAGIVLLASTVVISIAQTTAPSGHIAGNWKWTINVGDNNIDMSAGLKLDGNKITGKFVDGFDNTSYDVQDGKIEGDQVTFKITRPFQDGNIESHYTGKLDGDAIKGEIEVKMTGLDDTTIDWSAKRSNESATTNPA